MKRLFVLLLLTSFIVLAACGGDSNNNNSTPPQLPDEEYYTADIPAGAPSIVAAQIGSINAYTSLGLTYVQLGMILAPQVDGNTYTWNNTSDGLTLKIVASKNDDGSLDWAYFLNGSSSTDPTTYNNWQALDGFATADGKAGHWLIFSPNTTTPVQQIEWANDESSNKEIIATTYSEDGNLVTTYTKNADGSGSLITTLDGEKTFESTWSSIGAGTWTSYVAGQAVDSGTWP